MDKIKEKLKQNKSTNLVFGISSLAGIARGIIGFPLEQPLEAIKT